MKAKKFPEAIPAPGCISVHPSRNLLRHAGHILRLLVQILRSGQPEFDVQLPVSANHNLFNDLGQDHVLGSSVRVIKDVRPGKNLLKLFRLGSGAALFLFQFFLDLLHVSLRAFHPGPALGNQNADCVRVQFGVAGKR